MEKICKECKRCNLRKWAKTNDEFINYLKNERN